MARIDLDGLRRSLALSWRSISCAVAAETVQCAGAPVNLVRGVPLCRALWRSAIVSNVSRISCVSVEYCASMWLLIATPGDIAVELFVGPWRPIWARVAASAGPSSAREPSSVRRAAAWLLGPPLLLGGGCASSSGGSAS